MIRIDFRKYTKQIQTHATRPTPTPAPTPTPTPISHTAQEMGCSVCEMGCSLQKHATPTAISLQNQPLHPSHFTPPLSISHSTSLFQPSVCATISVLRHRFCVTPPLSLSLSAHFDLVALQELCTRRRKEVCFYSSLRC